MEYLVIEDNSCHYEGTNWTLIKKDTELKWKGEGSFCGDYSWAGYKNAHVIHRVNISRNKVRTEDNKEEQANVYSYYGCAEYSLTRDTDKEAIDIMNKMIDDPEYRKQFIRIG